MPGVGPTDGNRLPDNPTRNAQTTNEVKSLVITNGGSQVVVSGNFYTLNGQAASGVGALDAATGATNPFQMGTLITNQGINSAVYSLSTDGTTVYGTGYDYYGPGNLEGSFAATAAGGVLQWVNDCHGDTYSSVPFNGALYMAGHPHNCEVIGATRAGPAREQVRHRRVADPAGHPAVRLVGRSSLPPSSCTGSPT